MGKGGGGTSTTVQKADPWSGVQPYLTSAYQKASNLYENTDGPQMYPGQTYVSPSDLTLESRGAIEDYARNGMNTDINSIRGSYGTLLGAADVNNNPYLYAAAQGAIRPVFEQLTEQALPSIRSGAINTGQYGGSRQALAEGTAIGKATQAALDTTAGMYSDAYNQGLDTMTKAMLFGPQIMSLSQMPAQTLGQLGAAQEGDQQKALSEAMSRWDYSQNLPYQQLSNYLNLLNGASPYSSTTSSQYGGSGSPLLGALGGVTAAGSLIDGGLAYGLTNPFSWPLLLGGGLLGGLLS